MKISKSGKLFQRLAFLCFVPLLMSCHYNKPVSFFLDNNDFVNFKLKDDNLKTPFHITSDTVLENGGVYFVTSKGTVWLEGKPVQVKSRKNKFEAKWNLNNRQITISFTRKSNKYHFTFAAFPDTGIIKWGFSIAANDSEYFTGLFERVVDGNQNESWRKGIQESLNIRGQSIEMLIKPTLSLYCPFYLSSNNYGLFIKGNNPGHFDICKSSPNIVFVEFEGTSLKGIVYTASNPAEIVQQHSLNVGPTIVPPLWAFAPYRCRENMVNRPFYYDKSPVSAPYNSTLVEDILMMKALDIPYGAYLVDKPWATGPLGYDDFNWDTIRFPKAKKMINWLHNNNTKFMLWVAPWVSGNMKKEAEKMDYTQPLVSVKGGPDTTIAASIDFINPNARKWWQQKGIEKMLNQGVDGFMMDYSDEEVPSSDSIKLFDGRTLREVKNQYPLFYLKAANESCKKLRDEDFMLMARAGYSGSSRYGAFWGGEIAATPEGLRAEIIAVQRCAVIGFPIWGSNSSWHLQGEVDKELYARWLAFGCFNPIMEFGPANIRTPWDMPTAPAYDTTLIAIWRLYAKIHDNLRTYSYNLAKEANETGMPIVRPLFLMFPDQKDCWVDWRTFMYGPDILVSAVWKQGTIFQRCYLPGNVNWVDAWDPSKVLKGGQWVEIPTPYHKIPIFLREGTSVYLGDLNQIYSESYQLARKKPNMKELEKRYVK